MISWKQRTGALLGALLGLTLMVSGCSSSTEPAAKPTPSPTPSTATPAPTPRNGACHAYAFNQALSSHAPAGAIGCGKPHTTETYAVGQLDTVVDGHLLSIDSDRVQQQLASVCTPKLRKFLGGSLESLRLSMLRAVWFGPTPTEAEAGANWYRCDVIGIAGPNKLGKVRGSLKGVLAKPAADGWALCGTGTPGKPGFTRVPCRADHGWEAISTFPLDPKKYPAPAAADAAGESTCKDAARGQAEDPLKYEWSYEVPTKEQWKAGQTYGVCWAGA